MRPADHAKGRAQRAHFGDGRDAEAAIDRRHVGDEESTAEEMRRHRRRDQCDRPAARLRDRVQEHRRAVEAGSPAEHGDRERRPHHAPTEETRPRRSSRSFEIPSVPSGVPETMRPPSQHASVVAVLTRTAATMSGRDRTPSPEREGRSPETARATACQRAYLVIMDDDSSDAGRLARLEALRSGARDARCRPMTACSSPACGRRKSIAGPSARWRPQGRRMCFSFLRRRLPSDLDFALACAAGRKPLRAARHGAAPKPQSRAACG